MPKGRVLAGLAGLLAGLTALTGCALRPACAFIVDGQATTEAQVTEASQSCVRSLKASDETSSATAEALRAQVMQTWLAGTIGERVAAAVGQVYTEEDRELFLNQLVPNALLDPGCKTVFLGWATAVLTADALGEESYVQQVALLGVEVNPRYGRFDAAAMTETMLTPDLIFLSGTGSLSQIGQGS